MLVLPFLKSGMIIPFFHEFGNWHTVRDLLNNKANGFAIESLVHFNNLWLILSSPTDLFGFKTSMISIISDSVIRNCSKVLPVLAENKGSCVLSCASLIEEIEIK